MLKKVTEKVTKKSVKNKKTHANINNKEKSKYSKNKNRKPRRPHTCRKCRLAIHPGIDAIGDRNSPSQHKNCPFKNCVCKFCVNVDFLRDISKDFRQKFRNKDQTFKNSYVFTNNLQTLMRSFDRADADTEKYRETIYAFVKDNIIKTLQTTDNKSNVLKNSVLQYLQGKNYEIWCGEIDILSNFPIISNSSPKTIRKSSKKNSSRKNQPQNLTMPSPFSSIDSGISSPSSIEDINSPFNRNLSEFVAEFSPCSDLDSTEIEEILNASVELMIQDEENGNFNNYSFSQIETEAKHTDDLDEMLRPLLSSKFPEHHSYMSIVQDFISEKNSGVGNESQNAQQENSASLNNCEVSTSNFENQLSVNNAFAPQNTLTNNDITINSSNLENEVVIETIPLVYQYNIILNSPKNLSAEEVSKIMKLIEIATS